MCTFKGSKGPNVLNLRFIFCPPLDLILYTPLKEINESMDKRSRIPVLTPFCLCDAWFPSLVPSLVPSHALFLVLFRALSLVPFPVPFLVPFPVPFPVPFLFPFLVPFLVLLFHVLYTP